MRSEEPNPSSSGRVKAEAIDTSDVLRRVAGTTAIHIYEARYAADGSYVCTAFVGEGLGSLLGPLPEGVDEEEAWEAAVHPDDIARYAEFSSACRRAEAAELEFRLVGYDGVTRWVWERARPRVEDGVVYVDGIVADVTDRREAAEALAEAQATLEHLAYHDALTDLPNRLLFQKRLERAIEHARREGSGVAVLFVDLDDFKLVNDCFGHAVGDHLLCEVAARLRAAVATPDAVARLGGDEFLVLVRVPDADPATGEAEALSVAADVTAALDARYAVVDGGTGTEIYTSASIGVSLYPGDADNADAMLTHADLAMYRAKERARGGHQIYRGDGHNRFAQLSMAGRLRGALDRGELVLYYQPLVELGGRRIVGVEALLRWSDQDGGLVLPGEFIPLAERTGLIVPISEWVVGEACRQGASWAQMGHDLWVSVNIPPAMWQSTAMEGVMGTLEASRLAADRLMIELTESAVMADGPRIEPILAELRERGVRVAIDDFGMGHSSLSRLAQMRVSTLKIDRSFTHGVTTDPGARVLVSAMVQLARNLGLQPVAEGIETEPQRRFLLDQGCGIGQGFLFSPAVPPDEIERLLAASLRRAA